METNVMNWFRVALLGQALPVPSLALAEAQAVHDAVVIVFDDSGSMDQGFGGGDRMTAAKRGLKVVLQSMPKTTWVGLLSINGGWEYELGPYRADRMNAVIDSIHTRGGTPLARNIKAGADRLMAERGQQLGYGSYRLLVVTDGEETEDTGAIETYPPMVRSRGLTLDVIGVGIGEQHSLRRHAHTYRGADSPEQLERAMREVLAERVDPTDQTGGDAFEIVAGFDPGVAQAMITALGKLPNHPIGEQPRAAAPEGGDSSASVPWPAGSPSTVSGCGGCVSAGGSFGGLFTLVLLGAFWVAVTFMRRREHVEVRITRRNR